MRLPILVSGILLLFCSSCAFNSVEELRDESAACQTANMSFSQDILPILTLNCSSQNLGACHDSGASIGDYTTYQGVKAKVDNNSFEVRATVLRDMPPTYSNGPKALGECDQEKIKAWIDQGAQDN